MFDFLSRNRNLLILLAAWFLLGQLGSAAFYFIGGTTVLLLWRKHMYPEILMGFLFILVLSDSLQTETDFAKNFKNLYIVLLAAIALIERRRFGRLNRTYIYFLPFFAVGVVSLFWSPYPFVAAQKTLSYFLLVFAVPQVFMYAFHQKGLQVVKDMLFLGILLVLLGFVVEIFVPGLAVSHGGRFRGIFGNPNGLGIFCILILALVYLARDLYPRLLSKADLRWLVLPLVVAIVLTGSRTAIIGAMLFFFFTRFYRISPFIGFVVFLATVFTVELVASNLIEIVNALGVAHFFRAETLAEGSGRYIAWEFAWQNIQEHLWIGKGFAFDEWLMDKNQDMLNALGHQGGVHNTYLILWLNVGIVGLVFFLRALLLLFIRGARNTTLAFPVLWLVFFSVLLEPWLAASLNPFSILFYMAVTMISDEAFQAESTDNTIRHEQEQTVPA